MRGEASQPCKLWGCPVSSLGWWQKIIICIDHLKFWFKIFIDIDHYKLNILNPASVVISRIQRVKYHITKWYLSWIAILLKKTSVFVEEQCGEEEEHRYIKLLCQIHYFSNAFLKQKSCLYKSCLYKLCF